MYYGIGAGVGARAELELEPRRPKLCQWKYSDCKFVNLHWASIVINLLEYLTLLTVVDAHDKPTLFDHVESSRNQK